MTCYIAGAGSWYGKDFSPQPDDLVIAADGGYLHLKERGIRVDLLIGDFDSMEKPVFDNVQTFRREKDDTDLFLAVKEGYTRGYRRFVLYGATGGDRFDHTLGNLQVLAWIAKRGASALLHDRGGTVGTLNGKAITFSADAKGYLSVITVDEKAEGVTLKGLKYPLDNGVLTNDYPLGISNEFTGSKSEVSVSSGTLLLITAEENWEDAVW